MKINFYIKIFKIPLKKIYGLIKKIKIKFVKLKLNLLFGYKYNIFNNNKNLLIKLLINFISANFLNKKINNIFQVKHSKIIFQKSKKELVIIDRTISNDYNLLRDQFNKFHFTPHYEQIDERAYSQNKINYNNSILFLKKTEVLSHINLYLRQQLKLKKEFGKTIPVSEFFYKTKSLLYDQKKINLFPSNLIKRFNFILEENKSINIVPSLIEPWPAVSDKDLIFSDLSPVEFRNAPYLHDLCYIFFKYELYGTRRKKHDSFFPIVYDAFSKVANGEENQVKDIELKNLAKLLNSFIKPQDLIDAYILMIFFHSYVKYEATGKFLNVSSINRLDKAIEKHNKIFELII